MWVTGIIQVVITCWVTEQAKAQYHYPPNCAAPNVTQVDPANPSLKMPPIPYIPDTFQVRVEGNIIDKQYTMIAEEYYDNVNNRAALLTITNNAKDYMIFDYTNNQLIYDVNNNCSVADLQFDDNQQLFGMKQGTGAGGIPHIYGTNRALHFAKENGLMYKGTKVVRGILCDWWQSCMYWPLLLSNFTLDYYFSAYNWTEPDLSNQIPVRAEVTGLQLGSVNFHHIYEYFDYRNRIWADDSVFYTPPGKICQGRIQKRKIPVFSGQYSYREEVADTLGHQVVQAYVYYDNDNGMIRYDFKPIMNRFPETSNPVTVLHELSTGLAYAVEKTSGNCSIMSTYALAAAFLKNPPPFAYLDNTTYTYEGTRTVRGILCDVFASNRTDFHLPSYGNFSSVVEFLFMNQQWSLNNMPGPNQLQNIDIPVQMRIFTPDRIGYSATYNFYEFNSEEISHDKFSLAGCYGNFTSTSFIIGFPGVWNKDLLKYQAQFISSITDRISHVAHVSHLRIQNSHFYVGTSSLFFVATLLEVPNPLGTPQSQGLNMKLADAWNSLINDVATGNFQIKVSINGQDQSFKAASLDEDVTLTEKMHFLQATLPASAHS